ncbi:SDR family NAD(P)-dependent oxidoreductase [Oceanicoccus sp. KOV_DT_Chl]|uniref:SDR family NAD(P)-dependent oxidoreductase n=1 Tax=Oceanicoccus sp. KOV_DT_Chl TaxID=1904639 RepID=UPI000C7A983C|nr:SDR family NAD(P)-dependent oxidoreductase [Oceanicoccus sp. KOV_DT_Chl]
MSTSTMQDKVVVITGANSGIGLYTAIGVAKLGAKVIITARDEEKGRKALVDIKQLAGVDAELLLLDLASFASIKQCAADFLAKHSKLDVLINNAGLSLSERQETEDGYEYVLQVNHIGPFLLTRLLLDSLKAAAPSRIVNLSSAGHFGARKGMTWNDLQRTKSYGGQAYCEAKLGTIYFSKELSKRYQQDGITAYAVNPRFVNTNFGKDGDASGFLKFFFWLGKYWMMKPEDGALTSIWAASSDDALQYNGCYVQDCTVKAPQPIAEDAEAAQRFWELSEEWIAKAV